MSFSIKRALGSRKGWKIMPDDGHSIDGTALKTVVSMIKDMEFQVQVLATLFSASKNKIKLAKVGTMN